MDEIPTFKIALVGETKLKWVSLYRIRDVQKTLAFFEMYTQEISDHDATVTSTEITVNQIKIQVTSDDTIDEILKKVYRLLST